MEVDDPSYRTVKGILAVGADQRSLAPADTTSAATPAHLHGPGSLFAHLNTTDTEPDTGGARHASSHGDEQAVGA